MKWFITEAKKNALDWLFSEIETDKHNMILLTLDWIQAPFCVKCEINAELYTKLRCKKEWVLLSAILPLYLLGIGSIPKSRVIRQCSSVVLPPGMWTSRATRTSLTVTAHYIDKWEMPTCTRDPVRVGEDHTGEQHFSCANKDCRGLGGHKQWNTRNCSTMVKAVRNKLWKSSCEVIRQNEPELDVSHWKVLSCCEFLPP